MNPITHLLDEHKRIMAQVADLRKTVAHLAAQGEAALPGALPVLSHISEMMETQLALHAKKEDEALFPALEALLGAEDGPTHVMRLEHKEIAGQGELLRTTLHELNVIEHPQIEAGRERLRQLVTNGGTAGALRENADEIIRLLDMHFGKEEQILFPMAVTILDPAVLDEVATKMAALTL